MIKMPKINITISTELNDFILAQCGNSKRARAGYVRSILHLTQNGLLLLNSEHGVVAHKPKDEWKSYEELKKNKQVSSAIPIYPVEFMGDLMKELKEKLGISKETKATIDAVRKEQVIISKALNAPDPPKG